LRLVRRAATGHSGTGGGIEGQDVLFTHLCSSSSNEDREGGSWGAGGASESRGPVRRVFWMTWAAAPTIKRRPPVRRRLAAAARTGLGPSAMPGRSEATPPRKRQRTASGTRLRGRACGVLG